MKPIMAHERDFAWEWAAEGSKKSDVICIFCQKHCTGSGISRLKHHLSGIPRGGIKGCEVVATEVRRKCIAWRMGMNEDKHNKKKRKEESFEEYKERTTENVQVLFSGSSGASHSVPERSAGADDAPPPNVQSSRTSLSCSRGSPKRQQVYDQLFNTTVGDDIF